jgi:hypothetical protein
MADERVGKRGREQRLLVWDREPPPEVQEDRPVAKLFDPRDDPKGWDRASITLNTHPLHREPRVTPDDLRLPKRSSRLKLVGDCIAFTFALSLLSSFPLWVAGVMVKSDLAWAWIAVLALSVGGGLLLFLRGVAAESRPPEDLLNHP